MLAALLSHALHVDLLLLLGQVGKCLSPLSPEISMTLFSWITFTLSICVLYIEWTC